MIKLPYINSVFRLCKVFNGVLTRIQLDSIFMGRAVFVVLQRFSKEFMYSLFIIL